MVALKQLYEFHESGILNIEYTKGDKTFAVIGGQKLEYSRIENLCRACGWLRYRLSAFEIIEKTNKFMKSFYKNTKGKDLFENAQLEFENLPGVEYNKTIDRIVVYLNYKTSYVIIYGDRRAGGTYTVYKNASAVPCGKCRSLKQVVETIEKEEE